MSHSTARAAVAAEALTWLRTPYAHRQRVKGVGVDCAQFPLAVYAAAGVIAPTEAGPYCPQWHLHRSEELYLNVVLDLAREIAPEAAGLGDFAVWRYGRTFSHGAILLEGWRVIHALSGVGVTLGDRSVDEALRTRPMRMFSLWTV
jgi:cell wall-associated NlpC family hydrolase